MKTKKQRQNDENYGFLQENCRFFVVVLNAGMASKYGYPFKKLVEGTTHYNNSILSGLRILIRQIRDFQKK